MKKNSILVSLYVIALLLVMLACNKESEVINDEHQEKTAKIGDKVFIQDLYPNVFIDNPGIFNFSNNNGQNYFTLAQVPGQGAGQGSNGSGFFETNNIKYPLSYGIAYRIGEYRFGIGLYSEAFYISTELTNIYIAGLNIDSFEPYEIASGYYPYTNYPGVGSLNMAYIGFNVIDYDPGKYFFAENGNLIIDAGQNGYELHFEGILENGDPLIINYTGQLEIQVIEL